MEGSAKKDSNEETKKSTLFKKPVLIGKVGKLPKKAVPSSELLTKIHVSNEPSVQEIQPDVEESKKEEDKDTSLNEQTPKDSQISEQNVPLAYTEPPWSGLPESKIDYKFEVLKSGVILEEINLMKKSYWVFGRLSSCDISMAHPTVSRYHAVLQYKSEDSEDQPTGFYIYDLGSTHGTFLNKNRIKPKMYVRIQVGHMLKLGCSTRTYVLFGPQEDTENESELSVSELKIKRAEELRGREEQRLRQEQELEERRKKEEQKGVDWGMSEDASEEMDIAINPYAETNNEELYLDDPKRTLRGFMEREGHELHYELSERGPGQFLCCVELPLDDARGRPLVAEALVRGKKKEAVVQCALEACRILDRHGVLRQATHESRKRKAKNWEENDYYDSDEDTYLDRTGTIERKREKRMRVKQSQQPETYQSLVAKEKQLNDQIRSIEKQLAATTRANNSNDSMDTDDVDSLDHYMNELNTTKYDKYTIGKLKVELTKVKKEYAEVKKLMNIARPADLPPLITETNKTTLAVASTSGSQTSKAKSLPIYGKRLKVKVNISPRNIPQASESNDQNEEEDDEADTVTTTQSTSTQSQIETQEMETETETIHHENRMNTEDSTNNESDSDAENQVETRKGIIEQLEIKVSLCDEKALANLDSRVKAKISKTVTKLRKIAEEEESIVVDEKRLAVQKRKIFEQLSSTDSRNIEKHLKLSHALNKMTTEFCMIGDRKLKIVEEINKLADDINNIAVEIRAASKAHREQAVDRMKEFVEKAHKQQSEIFNEFEKLENSVADQNVLSQLTELYKWLCEEKTKMLENLETLKNTKITENSQLLQDIIQFELKSDNFVTTILKELKKIRSMSQPEQLDVNEGAEHVGDKLQDNESSTLEDKKSEVEDEEKEEELSPAEVEKRKKKNLRRIMQRQERAEAEKKKQYEEDAKKEDYNMWVPPENQTGDGRTSLNDKFGY